MAQWLDYQTVALAVIFVLGFGLVWWLMGLRDRRQGNAIPGEWHEILEVRPDAPFDEITVSYQRLIARCDADRAAKPPRAAVEWAFSMARRRYGLS
jgi:hypothetical protein